MTPIYEQATGAYISTGATTVVVSGAGTLHTLNILGGTAGTITVYDNTAGSGTVLAAFASTNTPGCFVFDIAFHLGLTIVTSAATQITVSTHSN